MRAPLVCGVAGGVGTTTIATALRARDLGVYRSGPADIVVCRSTSVSVGAAHRVLALVPGKPVLVVVADGPLRPPAPVKARLTMVQPHITALVWMPYVEHWRQIDNAFAQADAVLREADRVPKWLQPWAAALKQLIDAVLPLVSGVPAAAEVSATSVGADHTRIGRPIEIRSPGVPGPREGVVVQGSRLIPPPSAGN